MEYPVPTYYIRCEIRYAIYGTGFFWWTEHYRVVFMFSDTQNVAFVANWLMWIKIALNSKFWLVSYPHFLKISLKLIKCGLSYSLKCDPRPFSEFTKVCTILSLTASKNAFWRQSLFIWKFNLDWKVICPQFNVQSINGSLQNAFLEAVNDKMVATLVHSENGLGSHFRF